MSDIVVSAQGLGKRYRIGGSRPAYRTLRETLSQAPEASIRRIKRLVTPSHRPDRGKNLIWALRNLSFEVTRGEVLGIIGRNGAGKSTLFKILSRITRPTEGWAEVCGRVSSLLEVGTGFHPELTGRENIYLNGAILGMRKVEIGRKFDEIVAFAEVEKFIDTPVKHYSSGMFVRLAFSVAAHLEPDILIIDEVLSVGDAAFQQKCLGKMDEGRRGGRTVLFVSHNMAAVRRLCTSVLWLEHGECRAVGRTDYVVGAYESTVLSFNQGAAASVALPVVGGPDAPGHGLRLHFLSEDRQPHSRFSLGEPWFVWFDFEIVRPVKHLIAALALTRLDGSPIQTIWSTPSDLPPGCYRAEYPISLPLAETELTFAVGLSSFERGFYDANGAGHVTITAEGARVAPLRSSSCGVLFSTSRPAIFGIGAAPDGAGEV
jgi:ABC-type polysaccharide/polyol phosphate transport system ATPase subunit